MACVRPPQNLSIAEVLSLANKNNAQWIKKRRVISHKRVLYSVRSDFLVYYTDIWFRNRYPDTNRVTDIMKSIEQENEPDNRIYLAWIKDINKLMCFDGNHRREALIRLYYLKNFVCWIDIDVLTNVDDSEVVDAFRRINLGVSVPDVYTEENPKEPVSVVRTCEDFVVEFKNIWPVVIVDKNKTRAPYCTKNDLIGLVAPYMNTHSYEQLLKRFHEINNENLTVSVCKKPLDCYIFSNGLKDVKKRLSLIVLE